MLTQTIERPLNFGLIAELENTQISLPLTHVDARFRVTGDLASVEMDQIFEQNARQALNVTYTFPLPGEASVYRCEMHVNNRVIRAVVMEEKEARRFVQQKIAEGHRTALVEFNRDNVFTLELGNVAPGDRIVIRFAYLQPLERLGDQLSLRLPFNLGVRYIPGRPLLRSNRGSGVCDDTDQVPDASCISPPRISPGHPGAATLYVRGDLDAGELRAGSLISPSHSVRVDVCEDHVGVELAGEELVPDRDLVLRWQEPTVNEARAMAWGCRQEQWRYGLVQLRAPQQAAVSEERPQDIYFLLDRSGSMSGENWQQCTKALHAFVHELGALDRVWITCFESSYQDFSDSPMLRDELLADEAFQNFEQIETRGGTELLPALEHVLQVRARHSFEAPSRLILITDGQVGNEPEILEMMRGPQAARLPVHTFGIDRAVNDAFLQQMAAQSGGRCALMTPQDDIPAAVRKLAVTLRSPVLKDLQVAAGVEMPSPGQGLPDIHAGEVLLLPVRVQGSGRVKVTAHQPDGRPWSMEWNLDGAPESEAARLAWVKRRIKHLWQACSGAEAVELAIHHNLVCQGASFVAWDETAKTAVAKIEVVQPAADSNGNNIVFCMLPRRKLGSKAAKKLARSSRDDVLATPQVIEQHMKSAEWQTILENVLLPMLHIPKYFARELISALQQWAAQILGQQRHKILDLRLKKIVLEKWTMNELYATFESFQNDGIQQNLKSLREISGSWKMPKESNSQIDGAKLANAAAGQVFTILLSKQVMIDFCYVPSGEFIMGSPLDEGGRNENENQVRVFISRSFMMARTPVTQMQWVEIMCNNPGYSRGHNHPVRNVSWDDAQSFIAKLNERENLPQGWKYVLPTQAQWEYACRAEEKGPYAGGSLDEVGWYEGNSGSINHEVGRKNANAWGLHDMHGNVWEWCADSYEDILKGGTDPAGPSSGYYKNARGGFCLTGACGCRSASRLALGSDVRYFEMGFRPALVRLM
jgi:Ca-activated chloride channel family protein